MSYSKDNKKPTIICMHRSLTQKQNGRKLALVPKCSTIYTGLPTVPIPSGQSRFSALCPDRIFASVGTIQCPDFPKYKIQVTRLHAKQVNYQF